MSRPTHLMIAVSGFSGTGKDECAKHLVQSHHAMHTGLADPAKRHMADVYGFTEQQLFGPSHFRNAGDPRYPKNRYRDMAAHPLPSSAWAPGGQSSEGWHFFDSKIDEMAARDPEGRCSNLDHVDGPLSGWRRYFFRDTDPRFFLSPREVLQLYCEQLNNLYLDTWIRKGIEVHKRLAEVENLYVPGGRMWARRYAYTRMGGLTSNRLDDRDEVLASSDATSHGCVVTCFSDFRHKHEISLARQSASDSLVPVLVRVKRPGIEKPPFDHRSETEQATIPDSEFDFVIDNSGTIEDLQAKMDHVVETASVPGWRGNR